MIRLNIHEAKTHLSKYLNRLKEGDVIVLCKHNEPIAEIRPIRRALPKKRPLGLGPKFKVDKTFFDPLPEDMVKAFYGD